MYMKSLIAKAVLLTLMMGSAHTLVAQVQTDPKLTATVAVGDNTVSGALSAGNSTNIAILGINTGITVQLSEIRAYEEKMYNYLREAQSVIRNAYDIVKCGDLTVQIYNNLKGCTEAIVNHPQGALISTIVSKEYTQIVGEVTGLYGYITSLVNTTKKEDGKNEILLNSAERIAILSSVKRQLRSINRKLCSLRYEIEMLRWSDIPRRLAPYEYYTFVDSKAIVKRIKRDIDRL